MEQASLSLEVKVETWLIALMQNDLNFRKDFNQMKNFSWITSLPDYQLTYAHLHTPHPFYYYLTMMPVTILSLLQ